MYAALCFMVTSQETKIDCVIQVTQSGAYAYTLNVCMYDINIYIYIYILPSIHIHDCLELSLKSEDLDIR